MTREQAEIIVALADNRMCISEVAKKVYMHRTTVTYKIKRIRKTTKRDPLDFHDLCILLEEAKKILADDDRFFRYG